MLVHHARATHTCSPPLIAGLVPRVRASAGSLAFGRADNLCTKSWRLCLFALRDDPAALLVSLRFHISQGDLADLSGKVEEEEARRDVATRRRLGAAESETHTKPTASGEANRLDITRRTRDTAEKKERRSLRESRGRGWPAHKRLRARGWLAGWLAVLRAVASLSQSAE